MSYARLKELIKANQTKPFWDEVCNLSAPIFRGYIAVDSQQKTSDRLVLWT
jgi:hypothetical protein